MKYLIWSAKHEMWWRPDRAGYTKEPTQAGRYERDEAQGECEITWHSPDPSTHSHMVSLRALGLAEVDADAVQDPTCAQCGLQTMGSGFVRLKTWESVDVYSGDPILDIHRTCVWPWLSSHPECAVSMAPDSAP